MVTSLAFPQYHCLDEPSSTSLTSSFNTTHSKVPSQFCSWALGSRSPGPPQSYDQGQQDTGPSPVCSRGHMKQGEGSAILLSSSQDWLPGIPNNKVNSSVLPRWGAQPLLLCAAAGVGQGQFSPCCGCLSMGQRGGGIFPSVMLPHGRQEVGANYVTLPCFPDTGSEGKRCSW